MLYIFIIFDIWIFDEYWLKYDWNMTVCLTKFIRCFQKGFLHNTKTKFSTLIRGKLLAIFFFKFYVIFQTNYSMSFYIDRL